MSERPIQLYSGVQGALKRDILFRGSLIAAVGISMWVIAGIVIPAGTLSVWGIPLFLIGGALIAFGLVPYRRLSNLEAHPYHLVLHPDGTITLSHKGKVRCRISVDAITKIAYQTAPGIYGIAVWVKPGSLDDAYTTKIQRRHSCDLFLPYFGRHACTVVDDFTKTARML